MAIFRKLIQHPSSPEKALKALTGAAKYKGATFARLADVNELSRSENDTAFYTTALSTNAATVAITTKKGIIKITGVSTATLTITLTNPEFLVVDAEKYHVSATVAHGTINAAATAQPIVTTDGSMAIRITQVGTSAAWISGYLSYTIVRIGD